MTEWRRQLQEQQQSLQRLLLRRTPERFDNSEKANQLKKTIQSWNRRTRQIIEAAPRTQQYLSELVALGNMRYTTLVEVKDQLRLRGDLIAKVIGRGHGRTKVEKPSPLKVKLPAPSGYRYDFCLSFAGEDREFATRINRELRRKRYRTFFDQNQEAQTRLLGRHGPDILHEVFYRESQLCLLFISQSYKKNVWPSFERKSIQQRQLEQGDGYIIPIRLDETELPGFHTTTGYLKRQQGTPFIVRNVIDKLKEAQKGDSSRQIARAAKEGKPRRVVRRQVPSPRGHLVLLEDRVYTARVTRGDNVQVTVQAQNMRDLIALRTIKNKKESWATIRFAEHFSGQDMQVMTYGETTEAVGRTQVTIGLQATGQRSSRVLYGASNEVERQLRHLLLGEKLPNTSFGQPKESVIELAATSTTSIQETARLAQLLAVYFLGRDQLVETIDLLSFQTRGKGITVQFKGKTKNYLGEVSEISLNKTISLDKGKNL